MKKIVLILIAVLFLSFNLSALEKERAVSIYREKLIISDFVNNSAWKELGEGLTDDLVTLFVKTKRFDIIERQQLLKILKEQELQLSGIVNDTDAVKVGQLIGANYMIFGSITMADGSHSERRITKKFKDKKTKKVFYKNYIVTTYAGRVTISARLVEITTGRVIMAKLVGGVASHKEEREKGDRSYLRAILKAITSKDDRIAKEAYHKQMHQKLVNNARLKAAFNLVNDFLKEFPLSGYILNITEDDDYLIDLGTETGMNSEVNLKIVGAAEKMKHPVTGEIISVRTKQLGYLKVIDLGSSSSVAKIVKGDNEMVTPGLKVEVVEPVFIWHRSLASFLVPGLGQMLEKRWLSGILFLVGEAALIGGACYFYYRSTPAFLESQNLLDTTVWPEKGTQYEKAETQALISMWVFIGLEAIVHIWDTIDAGYPAEKNRVFVKKRADENIHFAFDNSQNQNTYCLRKSFRF